MSVELRLDEMEDYKQHVKTDMVCTPSRLVALGVVARVISDYGLMSALSINREQCKHGNSDNRICINVGVRV